MGPTSRDGSADEYSREMRRGRWIIGVGFGDMGEILYQEGGSTPTPHYAREKQRVLDQGQGWTYLRNVECGDAVSWASNELLDRGGLVEADCRIVLRGEEKGKVG